jgi:hypothetical protein
MFFFLLILAFLFFGKRGEYSKEYFWWKTKSPNGENFPSPPPQKKIKIA